MSNFITTIGRLTLVAILLTAGAAKIINPEGFASNLESFKLFPQILIPLLARFTPALEIFTALLLVLKSKEISGTILATLLSASFVLSLSWGILTNSVKECGCFGDWEIAKVSPEMALLRASTILILSSLLTYQLIKVSRIKHKK
jgi:hypothetical protein